MVMRKIFFGTILFFSLAFLAACGSGSSGSSGAAGATGATGAAGADGTDGSSGGSSVPDADSDLAIDNISSVDTNVNLGQVAKTFNLSGTDNLSADSRVRYYAYFGRTATSKEYWVTATSGEQEVVPSGNCYGVEATATWPLDTRIKAEDNCTLTIDGGDQIGLGDGSTYYLTVCPGNDAGDATTCASTLIGDRGTALAAEAGIAADNHSEMVQLVAETSSSNDFVALRSGSKGVLASKVILTTRDAAVTETRDSTGFDSDDNATKRTVAFSKYYVAGVKEGETDNVSYAPVSSSSGIGTAVSVFDGGSRGAIDDIMLADGGSTTMLLVGESDNVTIYTVGASALTMWNDNLTDYNLYDEDDIINQVRPAFAVSPNGDRAVLVHFYDNTTSSPMMAAFSPTGVTRGGTPGTLQMDNDSYWVSGAWGGTDNDTGMTLSTTGWFGQPESEGTYASINPDAAAAWCDDDSPGGALYIAASADNLSGLTFSKWGDNGTSAPLYMEMYSLFELTGNQADNVSTDNITSLAMACDPQDDMPVIAIGYDSTNGDIALAKFDNLTANCPHVGSTCTSGSFTSLFTDAAVARPMRPVTLAISSDGSAYAVGYNAKGADTCAGSCDNASIRIFYDE